MMDIGLAAALDQVVRGANAEILSGTRRDLAKDLTEEGMALYDQAPPAWLEQLPDPGKGLARPIMAVQLLIKVEAHDGVDGNDIVAPDLQIPSTIRSE